MRKLNICDIEVMVSSRKCVSHAMGCGLSGHFRFDMIWYIYGIWYMVYGIIILWYGMVWYTYGMWYVVYGMW